MLIPAATSKIGLKLCQVLLRTGTASGANSADRGGSPKQGNTLLRGRRHDEQVLVASCLVLREGGGPRSESGVLRAPAGSGPRSSLSSRTPRRGLSGVWRRGPRRRFRYRGSSTGRVSRIWIRSGTR